jgi:hypothetical protein
LFKLVCYRSCVTRVMYCWAAQPGWHGSEIAIHIPNDVKKDLCFDIHMKVVVRGAVQVRLPASPPLRRVCRGCGAANVDMSTDQQRRPLLRPGDELDDKFTGLDAGSGWMSVIGFGSLLSGVGSCWRHGTPCILAALLLASPWLACKIRWHCIKHSGTNLACLVYCRRAQCTQHFS